MQVDPIIADEHLKLYSNSPITEEILESMPVKPIVEDSSHKQLIILGCLALVIIVIIVITIVWFYRKSIGTSEVQPAKYHPQQQQQNPYYAQYPPQLAPPQQQPQQQMTPHTSEQTNEDKNPNETHEEIIDNVNMDELDAIAKQLDDNTVTDPAILEEEDVDNIDELLNM